MTEKYKKDYYIQIITNKDYIVPIKPILLFWSFTMRVKVSLYIAGKVHDEIVSSISYEEAKKTALARNPSGRVIKVSSVI